ncbi:MAG: hypothetical protein V4717_14840 [Bacteroidota bacterium]
MAKLTSPIEFTGLLGQLSFYKRKDSDQVLIRRKGGATKEKINTAQSMAGTRRVNAEFGGRATAAKFILSVIRNLKPLAGYNIASELNKLLRPLQLMDSTSLAGQRSVCLSKSPALLQGLSFNRQNSFDAIIRNPVNYTLSRYSPVATITLPALLPGINFFTPPGRFAYYGIVVVMGIVPDLHYAATGYQISSPLPVLATNTIYSDWYPVAAKTEPLTLACSLGSVDDFILPADHSLLLGIGIRFGLPAADGSIEQVRYAGAGKVVGVR